MKFTAIAAAFVALASATSIANATASATGVFNVTESIVNNNNGTWTYTYDLTNVSSSAAAWWFIVGSSTWNVSNVSASNSWTTTVEGSGFSNMSAPYAIYAYDNVDQWPNDIPNGVQLGGSESISFTSSVYDASQKEFLVDVQGYWNNPDFSYGGLTTAAVPEPATTALLLAGAGLLAVRARRRNAA